MEDFNPRAPCGARHRLLKNEKESAKFQSTRPVWGATFIKIGKTLEGGISIHAPRVGRDVCDRKTWGYMLKFQSTRPVWGATAHM